MLPDIAARKGSSNAGEAWAEQSGEDGAAGTRRTLKGGALGHARREPGAWLGPAPSMGERLGID